MEYGEFVERYEIYQRQWEEKWRRTRLIVASNAHVDPRKIIALRGDYDNIPTVMPKDKAIEYLKKRGLYDLLKRGEC